MAPKSLLRHKRAVSPLDELIDGHFQEFLDDPTSPDAPRRIVLVSGKLYYDLEEAREERGIEDVAIVRVEQFYPFHTELFERIVTPYRGAVEVVWAQEETQNRGGWTYMMPRLMKLFPGPRDSVRWPRPQREPRYRFPRYPPRRAGGTGE